MIGTHHFCRLGRAIRLLTVFGVVLGLAACSPPSKPLPIGQTGEDDISIRNYIITQWRQTHPVGEPPNIAVSEGEIMLTGTLSTPQLRVDALQDAWTPTGVKGVVNEIVVPASGDQTYAKDTALKMKLRARLTFDPDVVSTNYSIETAGGTIYLMGIAHSQEELAKVKSLAEDIAKGPVVSYVSIVSSPNGK